MGRSLRSQVLTHYKKLIRTAQGVFQNDPVRIASELNECPRLSSNSSYRYDTRYSRKFSTL